MGASDEDHSTSQIWLAAHPILVNPKSVWESNFRGTKVNRWGKNKKTTTNQRAFRNNHGETFVCRSPFLQRARGQAQPPEDRYTEEENGTRSKLPLNKTASLIKLWERGTGLAACIHTLPPYINVMYVKKRTDYTSFPTGTCDLTSFLHRT